MSAVARSLREEQARRLREMSPAERLKQALALGRQVITAYAAAHSTDIAEASRRLERAAQAGRRFSRVMRELI